MPSPNRKYPRPGRTGMDERSDAMTTPTRSNRLRTPLIARTTPSWRYFVVMGSVARLAMTGDASIASIPDALCDGDEPTRRVGGRNPTVFLDNDGTLTSTVDLPGDAVISESMRAAMLGRAHRCPVCVVRGRDRRVVQDVMGIDDLIVAGSHGFDPWSPSDRTLEHEAGNGFEELIERVTELVREEERDLLLVGRVAIFVGRVDDPEVGRRRTSGWFALDSIEEVERFLDILAR
jgi:hypothetical protein